MLKVIWIWLERTDHDALNNHKGISLYWLLLLHTSMHFSKLLFHIMQCFLSFPYTTNGDSLCEYGLVGFTLSTMDFSIYPCPVGSAKETQHLKWAYYQLLFSCLLHLPECLLLLALFHTESGLSLGYHCTPNIVHLQMVYLQPTFSSLHCRYTETTSILILPTHIQWGG